MRVLLGYILCSYVVGSLFYEMYSSILWAATYFSFMDYVGNELNIIGNKTLFLNKWHPIFHGWILRYDHGLGKWGTK